MTQTALRYLVGTKRSRFDPDTTGVKLNSDSRTGSIISVPFPASAFSFTATPQEVRKAAHAMIRSRRPANAVVPLVEGTGHDPPALARAIKTLKRRLDQDGVSTAIKRADIAKKVEADSATGTRALRRTQRRRSAYAARRLSPRSP